MMARVRYFMLLWINKNYGTSFFDRNFTTSNFQFCNSLFYQNFLSLAENNEIKQILNQKEELEHINCMDLAIKTESTRYLIGLVFNKVKSLKEYLKSQNEERIQYPKRNSHCNFE